MRKKKAGVKATKEKIKVKDPRIHIHDAEVLAMLPKIGFIHDFCHFMFEQSEAPTIYSVAVGIVVLSGLVSSDMYKWSFGGNEERVNVYSLLVGPSRTSKKSTVIAAGQKFLMASAPDRVGKDYGSYEGLLESMDEKPHQAIFSREFSRFLGQAKNGGHLTPLKDGYTDVYDCGSVTQQTAHAERGADNPRISLVGGINFTFLTSYMEESDLTNGFWARFFVVEAARERHVRDGDITPDPEGKAHLIHMLERFRDHAPTGVVQFNKEAADLYRKWEDVIEAKVDEVELENEALSGVYSQAMVYTRKIATLMAIDRNICIHKDRDYSNSSRPFMVAKEDIQCAIRIVRIHIASMARIIDNFSPNAEMKDRLSVLKALCSGRIRSWTEIVKTTRLASRRLELAVDGLITERLVGCYIRNGTKYAGRLDIPGGEAKKLLKEMEDE